MERQAGRKRHRETSVDAGPGRGAVNIHCRVSDSVERLCSVLQAYNLPDDFDATNDHLQTVVTVRDRYTNYLTLLKAVRECPTDCPIASSRGDGAGDECCDYLFAREKLEVHAHWLAIRTLDAWQRKSQSPWSDQTSGR